MNMVGDIDGQMHTLQVSNIPHALGNTMAPLNVSAMFENKLSPPTISTKFIEKLSLPKLSEDWGTNKLPVDYQTRPEFSLLSICISKLLGIPEALSNAIVERLPLMVTNVLARKLLPPLQLKPETRPLDVQRLFLKDMLPSANVASLFETSPSAWLEAKPERKKVWQVVSQIGRIVDCLPNLPPWLLVCLLPFFPILVPLYLGLKLLAILVRIASIMIRISSTAARLLLIWTKFREAYR